MSIELSNQEKKDVVKSHLRNVAVNKYNTELSLLEEKARKNPDQTLIDNLTAALEQADSQAAVLQAELDKLG